jgi:hypothetical protein
VVAAVVALAVITGRSWNTGAAATMPGASAIAVESAEPDAALELRSLSHERSADGFVVRGFVRNAVTSAYTLDGLAVAVLLYDRNGALVATGRGTADADQLPPGGEARFRIAIPNARGVVRYRVSFRTADGVVPHVDRRAAGIPM